jgi:hypothetical protein
VRNYIRSTPGHPISVSERGPNRRREARACRQRFDMLRAQCGGVPHWPGKIRSVPCADCTGQKQRNSWRPWPHAAPLLRRTQLAEKACASAVGDGWATATPGPRPRRLSRPDRWVHYSTVPSVQAAAVPRRGASRRATSAHEACAAGWAIWACRGEQFAHFVDVRPADGRHRGGDCILEIHTATGRKGRRSRPFVLIQWCCSGRERVDFNSARLSSRAIGIFSVLRTPRSAPVEVVNRRVHGPGVR